MVWSKSKSSSFRLTESLENKPRSRPRHRRRTISPPSIGPMKRKRTIAESLAQSNRAPDSCVLTRLPLSVRQLIWEAVIGGLRIHIIQRHKRQLRHIICSQLDSCIICREPAIQPVKENVPLASWSLLSLPLVCKQMSVCFILISAPEIENPFSNK